MGRVHSKLGTDQSLQLCQADPSRALQVPHVCPTPELALPCPKLVGAVPGRQVGVVVGWQVWGASRVESQGHWVVRQDVPAARVAATVLWCGRHCLRVPTVELSPLAHLILIQARYQLVNNVLKGLVWSDAEQRLGLMHLNIANGTELAGFQVSHNARFAKRMEALNNGGGINIVASTQYAQEVRMKLRHVEPPHPTHPAILNAGGSHNEGVVRQGSHRGEHEEGRRVNKCRPPPPPCLLLPGC